METKKTFVTSDWHVGHSNSIGYDHRPFRNLNHMHQVLINNYNASVPKDGLCYFLGDLGWSKSLEEVYPKLNGKKVVVLGNHDGSKQKFYDLGFDLVLNGVMITLGKSIITMTHCPLRGVYREGPLNQDGEVMKGLKEDDNWHGEKRHKEYSFPDFGQTLHCHGHTHKRKENDVRTHNQWDVSVVGNDYRPISLSAIEAYIATKDKK